MSMLGQLAKLRGNLSQDERWLQRLQWRSGSAPAQADPSAQMFTGIRRRLTLWYSAVLAAILLLSGLLLYLGMQAVLLGPVTQVLRDEAQRRALLWQEQSVPPRYCLPILRESLPVACYDASGKLIGSNQLASFTPAFLSTSLAHAALADASIPAMDTVTGNSGFGTETIRRCAVVVRDPTSHQALGVVQVGLDIEAQVDALRTLLLLLLVVGGLTLLGSAIGGALLAHRALAPARLAFTRQQAFIADASHELRSPLTLLRADAEVLLRGRERLDPDDAPLLDDIVVEVEHMGALAENLLTLARLDHGVYHIEQDVVDLDEVATDVVHRARALAEERQIQLVVERAGEAEALVIGDLTWLGEAVLILLDNGIKYNRPGGTVTLRAFRDGRLAVLEVCDTGNGIAAEHLQHLGERFYRVDKARSRQMGGAGLGLSIARSIAAEHHGILTITSVPDQGTTAALRLPAADISRQEREPIPGPPGETAQA
jgi:signal transduction histidine kinase